LVKFVTLEDPEGGGGVSGSSGLSPWRAAGSGVHQSGNALQGDAPYSRSEPSIASGWL